ncbi:hypothetical protein [Asticcacaulis sp.]|uniref:hypothetical protein n=1 Tax=Asticcacaulis sp. TaxID=1872648 RepID=UPI003F7B7C53
MIIESSAKIVRAEIAKRLIAYKLTPEDRIGATCDVIEYLALRMREPSDVDVFNLAVFVQRELDLFDDSDGNYTQTVDTLAALAFSVKLGSAAFYQAISRLSECFEKRARAKASHGRRTEG